MELSIKGNGMLIVMKEMAEEFKFGMMVVGMRGIGREIKQMAKVDLSMQTEMFIKGIGLMIKLMVMEYTFIKMVHDMKVIGVRTSNMVKDKSHGQMEQSTKETM